MKFTMLIGPSGSGKTTYGKWLAQDENGVLISSDDIREEFGDVNDQSRNREVFAIAHERIISNLKAGKYVIYDATNMQAKYRVQLLKQLPRGDYEKEALLILCRPDICFLHDKSRERSVGEEIIMRQLKNFNVPGLWEGFTSIHYHRTDLSFYNKNELKSEMIWFDQKNHHHTESLGVHCASVAERIQINDYILHTAACWHDVGKLLTQTIGDDGEAHYYNHQNVGAYMSFFIFPMDTVMWDIATVIEHHMAPFSCDKKGLERLENRIGKNLMKYVMELHKADIGKESVE